MIYSNSIYVRASIFHSFLVSPFKDRIFSNSITRLATPYIMQIFLSLTLMFLRSRSYLSCGCFIFIDFGKHFRPLSSSVAVSNFHSFPSLGTCAPAVNEMSLQTLIVFEGKQHLPPTTSRNEFLRRCALVSKCRSWNLRIKRRCHSCQCGRVVSSLVRGVAVSTTSQRWSSCTVRAAKVGAVPRKDTVASVKPMTNAYCARISSRTPAPLSTVIWVLYVHVLRFTICSQPDRG